MLARHVPLEREETVLAAAGFIEIETWLQPWPVVPAEPTDFLRRVTLRTHLQRLPPGHRDAFVARVAERLP